jgi:hypothetical protein
MKNNVSREWHFNSKFVFFLCFLLAPIGFIFVLILIENNGRKKK